jgi:DNA-directed RNA polymerase subunit K/omega
MRELFKEILEAIDSRLPSYFLVKGGRLEVAPLAAKEYANLIANGYQPIVEVQYEQLDKSVLEALNKILNGLGNRALLLYPLAVSAIISHEARRDGSPLNKALYGKKDEAAKTGEDKEVKEDKRQRRRKE